MEFEHESCNYIDSAERIGITCQNCIDKNREARCSVHGTIDYWIDCKCNDKMLNVSKCETCENIKSEMGKLRGIIRNLLFELSNDMVECEDCEEKINQLHDMSSRLRTCNRIILEKM